MLAEMRCNEEQEKRSSKIQTTLDQKLSNLGDAAEMLVNNNHTMGQS